jgi:hypothetical protein
MDFFSFNYKPKDFKGKTPKDIVDMKPNKVGDDFFTKYAEEIKTLSEEEINAIQLLSDLKNKTKILEKCYTKRGHHSVVPGHKAMPQPAVATQAADMRELVPPQTGGKRRSIRSRGIRSRGKRSRGIRSRGKRSRGKRGGKKTKKRGGKKTKKRGGAIHPIKMSA